MKLACPGRTNSFKADNIFLYFVCFVSSGEIMFNFWEMHPAKKQTPASRRKRLLLFSS